MVPPTVERRFQKNRGSCQLWITTMMSLKKKFEEKIKTPSYKVFYWNRAFYKQRAFDNLIANNDRHQNQYLITEDWRMILIDHSRSFRTSKKFTKKLIYDEKYKEGPTFIMKELPRALYEKIKSLNAEVIKNAVGEYLTDKEIEAMLVRKDLIVKWVEDRIKKMGEDKVLYD
jgi:outer membrane cobalamin receptor